MQTTATAAQLPNPEHHYLPGGEHRSILALGADGYAVWDHEAGEEIGQAFDLGDARQMING